MARIRTIKPEFFTSEDIVALSPMARLLYIALWCEADREGRLAWKPKTFKMRYLPADNCDVADLCQELTAGGLVKLYGDGFAYIPSFGKHQHLNPREASSTLPDPDASATRAPRVEHATVTVKTRDSDAQGGWEGKGREVNLSSPDEPAMDVVKFPQGFETFWSAYPKKVGKDAAAKAYARRKVGRALLDAMLAAVDRQRTGPDWTKDGGQYIPNPATWLNEGRWMDEDDGRGASVTSAAWAGAI